MYQSIHSGCGVCYFSELYKPEDTLLETYFGQISLRPAATSARSSMGIPIIISSSAILVYVLLPLQPTVTPILPSLYTFTTPSEHRLCFPAKLASTLPPALYIAACVSNIICLG